MAIDDLRARILTAAYFAGEGHIPSALSIVDIVHALHTSVMVTHGIEGAPAPLSPENWRFPNADRFVLSKGHGSLALYAVLAAAGFITPDDMGAFAKPGGLLGGHPDAGKVPGVWASTGSLGHGLPFAAGLALAKKIQNEKGRIFCLVGDGEMQEGSSLEALRLIYELDLANLCLIVDSNGSHGKSGPLIAMLRGYEFHVRITDGHDAQYLIPALGNYSTYPVAVIARTAKGRGIKVMERDPSGWHRRIPTESEFEAMMEAMR